MAPRTALVQLTNPSRPLGCQPDRSQPPETSARVKNVGVLPARRRPAASTGFGVLSKVYFPLFRLPGGRLPIGYRTTPAAVAQVLNIPRVDFMEHQRLLLELHFLVLSVHCHAPCGSVAASFHAYESVCESLYGNLILKRLAVSLMKSKSPSAQVAVACTVLSRDSKCQVNISLSLARSPAGSRKHRTCLQAGSLLS